MTIDLKDLRKVKSACKIIEQISQLYDGDERLNSFTENLKTAMEYLESGIVFADEFIDDRKYQDKKSGIIDLSTWDSDRINAAVETVKERLKKQGAKESQIDDNYIDYHLCMIFYDAFEKTGRKKDAIKAVKNFADSVTYNPAIPYRQPIFPKLSYTA